MRPITLAEAEYIAYRAVQELMNYEEPLGAFSTRYPHRLESCLDQPFQEFDAKQLYPDLFDKAALLFYLVIKNHPFENGNKRMAVMLLIYFLMINRKWLSTTPELLYDVALGVAESNPKQKDEIVGMLTKSFRKITKEFSDEEIQNLHLDTA